MEVTIKVFTSGGKPIGETTEESIDDAMEVIQSHIEAGNMVLAGVPGDTKIYNADIIT